MSVSSSGGAVLLLLHVSPARRRLGLQHRNVLLQFSPCQHLLQVVKFLAAAAFSASAFSAATAFAASAFTSLAAFAAFSASAFRGRRLSSAARPPPPRARSAHEPQLAQAAATAARRGSAGGLTWSWMQSSLNSSLGCCLIFASEASFDHLKQLR